jgi:hypothetical protein
MAVTRILTGALGLAALGWSALALASFQATAPFEGQARQIIAGEAFRDDAVDQAAATLDGLAAVGLDPPARWRAAAILRLRLVESALDRADPAALDARMAALRGALHAAMQASPADPLLWLTLYWLDNTQNGFRPDNLATLAMSYAQGPREGWIALRRNRLALAVFPGLDGVTQGQMIDEFAGMVDARLTAEAADNLTGPGWPIRDRLVARLAGGDPAAKQALARALRGQGIALAIPGVAETGERPWR